MLWFVVRCVLCRDGDGDHYHCGDAHQDIQERDKKHLEEVEEKGDKWDNSACPLWGHQLKTFVGVMTN